MKLFLDGEMVDEEEARISVFDRSFLYGDGLFETIRIYAGQPFRWAAHLRRFRDGADFLGISLSCQEPEMRSALERLIEANQMTEAVLRIHLSRGVGPRGYSTRQANQPRLIMTLHAAPLLDPAPRWRVITSSFRVLEGDPLASVKSCNKLVHILARREAETRGADEALLINSLGEVAEASSGNFFWIEDGLMATPPLGAGVLPGITRSLIFELGQLLSIAVREMTLPAERLARIQAAFVSLSTLEIVSISHLDENVLEGSPIIDRLQRAYRETVRHECETCRV